ncbi:alpha/beta fold hydrolase, partial [Ottowia sp.]
MDSPDTATANRAEPRFERRTVDGHELRIAVWAGTSADKPPLLLFNGIGSRIELMAPFVDHLDPEREIIALDVPGTGESPATPFPYRLWMMARLVGHLLEQLKVERVDALGVSWGGTLAQQFALQNPRRCRRLVLAATAAGGLLIPGDLRVLAKMTTPRRFKDPNFMRDNLGALYGGVARTDPEALTDFARLSRSPSRRGYLYQQMALAGWI